MADRVQNITINYKFNTSEVDKATQTLNKANQLSNQLQGAGQKAGSAINQEFQKSNKTILDMQTALTRLKSIIEVTSNPAKLKQLSAEYKNIKAQLDQATKSAFGFNKAVQDQGAGVQKLSGQFGSLLNTARAVFGAAIIRQVVDTTLEMAKLAGNAEGIERAFRRAFPDATALVQQLRDATRGTVTDVELMQRTLQATNLGVSVRELPVLFEFAAARAQQTGESVDYLVDSIVRGIGRKSPLILDNLGLSAVRLKEKFDGAALASQSVADVTRVVGEIAREELDKMGGFVETSAQKVDQLTAAWVTFKTELAKKIDSSGVIDFVKNQINNVTELIKGSTNALIDQAKELGASDALRVLNSASFKALQDNEQAKTDFIQQEINSRVEIERKYNVEIAQLSSELLKLREQDVLLPNEIARRNFLEDQVKALKLAVLSTKEARITFKAFLDDLTKEADAPTERKGIIERKREEIKALQKQIEETNKLSDLGVAGKLTSQLEIAQAELADLLRAFTAFKVPEFKLEIDDASKSLSNFEAASERIRKGLLQIAEGGVIRPPVQPTSVYEPSTWDLLKDDFESHWKDITAAGIDIQADQLKSIADAEVMNAQLRLRNLQDFYSEQQMLAGDNDRAKEQLRLREERETKRLREEIARKEKQARRSQVFIDIAAGIAKAFATYPWPYSLIPAAFVAAQGAAQLAIINRQPTNFAKGVIDIKGPGTATSDSIPANLSRGESVMTAWETKHAGDVLRDIRAKKLDNEKLRELKQGRSPVVSPAFDDKRLIKAIKDQKHPDVVRVSNIVYETKEYTDGYKKRVRSRSMGI